MDSGEYKSEVSARFDGVDHDYYRYEVVTRWWSTAGVIQWETAIYAVDDGERRDANNALLECWDRYLSERVFMTKERMTHRHARKDHEYAVMLVAG